MIHTELINLCIITIVKNDVLNIEKTLKSIINFKTFTKKFSIRFIVIDGFSTDGTVLICQKYINFIDFYKSELDNGIYDAFNKGVILAEDDSFILCINSGDILLNLDLLDKDFFTSNLLLASVIASNGRLLIPRIFTPLNEYNVFPRSKYWHQGFFIKKACILEMGLYKTDVGMQADGLLMTQASCIYSYKICKIPVAIFDLNGISNLDILSNLSSYKKVINKLQLNYPLVIFYKIKMFAKMFAKLFMLKIK